MKKKLTYICVAAGMLFLTNACTDLKEQVLDERIPNEKEALLEAVKTSQTPLKQQ